MLPANTAASLATFTMVAACALGIGFMVRFFIALAGDGNKMRSGYRTRPKGVRSAPDAPCKELLRSETAVNPSGHLAMGVLRISTALALNSSRGNQQVAVDRPHLVAFAARARPRESSTKRSYGRR